MKLPAPFTVYGAIVSSSQVGSETGYAVTVTGWSPVTAEELCKPAVVEARRGSVDGEWNASGVDVTFTFAVRPVKGAPHEVGGGLWAQVEERSMRVLESELEDETKRANDAEEEAGENEEIGNNATDDARRQLGEAIRRVIQAGQVYGATAVKLKAMADELVALSAVESVLPGRELCALALELDELSAKSMMGA